MRMRTLVSGLVVISLGVVAFLVVQMSSVSRKDGVTVGARSAAAACDKKTSDCLPKLTYLDTSGAAYPPEAMADKIVVVNFWATWCKPCKAEIPALSRIFDRYKDKGVVMLGVMTDEPDEQTLLNFTSDHELVYPVVRADSEILLAFDYPSAIPTTFVFDRKGTQRVAHRGAISETQLGDVLDKLIAER